MTQPITLICFGARLNAGAGAHAYIGFLNRIFALMTATLQADSGRAGASAAPERWKRRCDLPPVPHGMSGVHHAPARNGGGLPMR